VRIVPQPEPVAPEGGTGAGGSLPAGDDGAAPSPASGITPAPEVAPAPETVPAPEAAPVPEAAPAPEAAAPAPEIAPAPEAAPTPEVAGRVPTDASTPEVAAEPVEPEPSEAFAEAEAEEEAPSRGASADAAEMAGEEQEAQVSERSIDWTPPPLARLPVPDGDDGVDDAGSNDDATAAGSGRTSTTAQGAERQQASSSATSTAGDEQEAAGNDQSGVGFAERGEALASLPAVEAPAVRLQRDRVVMRAQALLAQLDFYPAAVDGLLGERTIAAIRDFQKSMSMAETGEVSEALLKALEAQASAARSDFSDRPRGQGAEDAAVEAAESLQIVDIMKECRGKEAEWVYIAAINRHVLCGGLSAESPN
jgi:hypothetical protein